MLIAICVFRVRMEGHKALFIIAVISTIKMTTGSQFMAALPTCSTQQLLVLASSCDSRGILPWGANSVYEHWCICMWQTSSDWQLLIKMHHPLVLLFLTNTGLSWEWVGSLSLPQALSLPHSPARLGSPFLFCQTVKRSNYFQCLGGWSSVQAFKKEESRYLLKGSMAFYCVFLYLPLLSLRRSKETKQQRSDICHGH